MNVLQCSTYFKPVEGGLERVVYFLSKALIDKGHDVEVITSRQSLDGEKAFPSEQEIDGIKVKRMDCFRPRFGLEIPKEMDDKLFREADILHIHAHLSPFYLKALRKARKNNLPIVMHYMALRTPRKHPNYGVKLFGSLFEELMVKYSGKRIDRALARNKRDMDLLKNQYSSHLGEAALLEDGVPSDYFDEIDSLPFMEKHGLVGKDIVLFIGRLHKNKGPHVLVDAAREVLEEQEHRDTRFIFIGSDDGMKKKLEEKINNEGLNEEIRVLGEVSEETKLRALSCSNMLVLPSLHDITEVYPMVFSEAWAQKKPVIGSKVGGIPYRIEDGENGLLVEPGSTTQLAEAIQKLLKNKELAKEMGTNGKKGVKTWKEVAEEAEEIYSEAIRND